MPSVKENQGHHFTTLLLQRGYTSIKVAAHQEMTPHIDFPVEGHFKQNDQMSGLNLETHIF